MAYIKQSLKNKHLMTRCITTCLIKETHLEQFLSSYTQWCTHAYEEKISTLLDSFLFFLSLYLGSTSPISVKSAVTHLLKIVPLLKLFSVLTSLPFPSHFVWRSLRRFSTSNRIRLDLFIDKKKFP